MRLAAGTRLGPYEVLSALGAGGMGEVYRARDPRLGRDVAIKVLPEGLTSDPERLARFEREARAAAALNNPNILTVYDIGHDGTAPYIVSELLEGQSLAQRLFTAQPTSVRKVIDYAVQMARGLAAAHERGIVHRDLKPANVFVTDDGHVKILDFGLAKLSEREPVATGGSRTPTVTLETTPGVVLGTMGYMSPEQVRGGVADHRSDIFSFGAIVYELLSGRRAFQAGTAADTMAAILNEEPPDLQLQSARPIPPALARIVDRCLEKNPDARFQSTDDLAFSLEALSTNSGQVEALPPALVSNRRERIAWMLAGVVTLAAVVLAVALYVVSRPPETQRLRLTMTLPEGWSLALSSNPGEPTSLVVSPDGHRVAIVARRADGPTMILMRELDSPSARPLAGSEGVTSLFWSPDSSAVGFFADGKIKKVGLSGGVPTVLCDATAPFGGGTWGREGTIVFSMPDQTGTYKLWKVADAGGQPGVVLPDAQVPQGEIGEIRPWFLPDGRTFLYVALAGKTAVYGGRLEAPDRVKVVDINSWNVQYAEDHLLYLRAATLVAQPFDTKRLATAGDPVPIVDHVVRQGVNPGSGVFSASQNGILVYQVGVEAATETRLAWVDRQGHTLGTIGDRAYYRGIALSHDETRVAAVVGAPPDLYLINLSTGVSTQFTFDLAASFPVWSPDDRFIDFNIPSNGLPSAYRKPANGAGSGERLFPDQKGLMLPFDRSRDGSLLYVTTGPVQGRVDLQVVPGSGDRTPFRLAATPDDKRLGKFSPDGRWVAYVSNDASGQNLWVVPLVHGTGAGGVKWRISTVADGGTLPQWRGDGRELFYISSSKMLTVAQVNGDGQAFEPGPSKALFPIKASQMEGGYAGWPYAVSRDGLRFLVVLGSDASSPAAATDLVNVEVNWTAGLGR